MKRVILIVFTALCLVTTITIHNAFTDTIEKIDAITFSGDIYSALETREDLFVDLVFDAKGNLIESNIYEWDLKTDTKGQLLSHQENGLICNNVFNSNDLSADDCYLQDVVFDKDGELISDAIYVWDSLANKRGNLIARISDCKYCDEL